MTKFFYRKELIDAIGQEKQINSGLKQINTKLATKVVIRLPMNPKNS